jgi:hypothetical protein
MKGEQIGQRLVDGVGEKLTEIGDTRINGSGIDLGAPGSRQRVWWGAAHQVMNFPATVRIAVQSEVGSIRGSAGSWDDDLMLSLLEQSKYCLLGGFTQSGGGPLCIAGAATACDGNPLYLDTLEKLMFLSLCGHALTRQEIYETSIGDVMHECCGGTAEQSESLSAAFAKTVGQWDASDGADPEDWAEITDKLTRALIPRGYVITNRADREFIAELQSPDGPVKFRVSDLVNHPKVPACRLATLTLPVHAEDSLSAWLGLVALNHANQQADDVNLALGSWSACPAEEFQFTFYQWMPRAIFDGELAVTTCISVANRGRAATNLRSLIKGV